MHIRTLLSVRALFFGALALLLSGIAGLAPRVALAEPAVLAVDGPEIYVDLGAQDGVGAGSELELLHEVVARDPRTGAVLRDRFALGTLTVVKSGARLSVATAGPDLAKRVLAGDRVRLVSRKRRFVDPWVAQVDASRAEEGMGPTPAETPPATPGAPAIDHVALARVAWEDTLGQPPERRITRWTAFLAADPRGPYRKIVENEIKSLELQVKTRDEAVARARSVEGVDRDPRIAHLAAELARTVRASSSAVLSTGALTRAVPGRPIDLSFLVRMPSAIARAWLYVRPEGEPGYRRIELAPDGDAYLRATIPADAVRPGQLTWYVEAERRGTSAQVTPVFGTQDTPQTIDVEARVEEAPIASGRSHIDAHLDYVDFDGKLGGGYDQYYQAEIDFTYRFHTPVHAVRLGFGTLSGTGGPRDVIDASTNCTDAAGSYRCRKVTFSYVYTEVEMKLRPNIAVMFRPQAGLLTTDAVDDLAADRCRGRDIEGCQFTTGFGARGRVRFGREDGTNLVVGAAFTNKVGTLLEAAYHWLPTPVVPVKLTVQVTDLPVPEDFGVRLIGDVGLRSLTWFYPSLRVSYQARDIDHSGISGGFAMNFDW